MDPEELLIKELEAEAKKTRVTLERVPDDRLDYRPHERSMTFGALATHVAEILSWTEAVISEDEFDFVPGEYQPPSCNTAAEILELFDRSLQAARECLRDVPTEKWSSLWTFKKSGEVAFQSPRIAVIRSMLIDHLIHHRGQLTVYLRVNGVPVPALYGPSADEEG